MRLQGADLLDLSPQAGKRSVRVLLSILILRGHKMVRASTTPVHKTLRVRRRKRKLWRYEKRNSSRPASHQTVSAGSSGMYLKCERNSQTSSSIHHGGVWPQPDPGNSLRNLNVNKDSVSAAGRDCGIDAPHQLNRKQQFWGHNFARLLQATAHNLQGGFARTPGFCDFGPPPPFLVLPLK